MKIANTKTCDFCHTIFNEQELSKQEVQRRASYCEATCPATKREPRFRSKIDSTCQDYMKGVFESYVASIEKGVTFMGAKTFSSLHRDIDTFAPYLFIDESQALNKIVADYETNFGKFVGGVLNNGKFKEIASGSEKSLSTPSDWADALVNVKRILDLAEQHVAIQIDQLFNQKSVKEHKKRCGSHKKSSCAIPCSETTLGCTYKPHPKYAK